MIILGILIGAGVHYFLLSQKKASENKKDFHSPKIVIERLEPEKTAEKKLNWTTLEAHQWKNHLDDCEVVFQDV